MGQAIRRVLIVDDEADLCDLIASQIELSYDEVSCEPVSNAKDALLKLQVTQYDLVISDINMPDMSGLELAKKINKLIENPPAVFMMTGYSHFSLSDINAAGAEKLFQKPEEIGKLIKAVGAQLDR